MNWKEMIGQMIERGETYVSIGRYIGRTPANVAQIAKREGHDPAWHAGTKLIAMHKRVMREFPKVDAAE